MVQGFAYNGRTGGENRPNFFPILVTSDQNDAKPRSNDREVDTMPRRWPEATDFGGTSTPALQGVRFRTSRTNSAVLQSVTSAVTTSTARVRTRNGS